MIEGIKKQTHDTKRGKLSASRQERESVGCFDFLYYVARRCVTGCRGVTGFLYTP